MTKANQKREELIEKFLDRINETPDQTLRKPASYRAESAALQAEIEAKKQLKRFANWL